MLVPALAPPCCWLSDIHVLCLLLVDHGRLGSRQGWQRLCRRCATAASACRVSMVGNEPCMWGTCWQARLTSRSGAAAEASEAQLSRRTSVTSSRLPTSCRGLDARLPSCRHPIVFCFFPSAEVKR